MTYTKNYHYYNNHPLPKQNQKILTPANYWRRQNIGVLKNIGAHKIFASSKYLQNIGVDEKLGVYKIIDVDENIGVDRNIGIYKIIGIERKIGLDKN